MDFHKSGWVCPLSFGCFIFVTFLQEWVQPFIIPPVMAYVADITTKGERGKAMGWIGAAISLGFMIGPGIGGFLSNVSLHFPFYFAGGATIVAAIIVILHPSNCQTCGTSIGF